ncbi:MAG: hypothetical protein AB7U83_06670 [Vicinamibacterales bacterium]
MKTSCVLVVSLLAVVSTAAAQAEPHVRPLDLVSSLAIERGLEESARVRALVAELEASNVIVHVIATPTLPPGLVGTMHVVTFLGATRYIRVHIATGAPPALRVATLAHELTHACEVARSAATSHAAVRELYRTIGSEVPGSRDAYETVAAQRAGAEVLAELRGPRRHPPTAGQ